MRVIGGKYKRRELVKLPRQMRNLRPTYDRVREDIFNILSTGVAGARFLDLYAGTGCVGIEAVSRGARVVTFVDSLPMSVRIIRQNCERLGIQESAVRMLQMDARGFIRSLKSGKFDIIFIDPPYGSDLFDETVDLIGEGGIVASGGIVVGQSDREVQVTNRGQIVCMRQLKCGKTWISFWENSDQ